MSRSVPNVYAETVVIISRGVRTFARTAGDRIPAHAWNKDSRWVNESVAASLAFPPGTNMRCPAPSFRAPRGPAGPRAELTWPVIRRRAPAVAGGDCFSKSVFSWRNVGFLMMSRNIRQGK